MYNSLGKFRKYIRFCNGRLTQQPINPEITQFNIYYLYVVLSVYILNLKLKKVILILKLLNFTYKKMSNCIQSAPMVKLFEILNYFRNLVTSFLTMSYII